MSLVFLFFVEEDVMPRNRASYPRSWDSKNMVVVPSSVAEDGWENL